jgi:hypothetical protein
MRTGYDDGDEELCPTMPRFSTMTDAEAHAIIAYLRSLPAVSNQVPDSICPPLKTEPGTGGMGTGGMGTGGHEPEDGGVEDSGTSDGGKADGGMSDGGMSDGGMMDGGMSDGGMSDGGGGCSINHLVISEVRSRGAGGASDEFIELYNPTSSPVTLDANWTLQSRSATGTTYSTRWKGAGGVIPAHGHFLIVGLAYTQSPAKDASLSSGITDAASIILRQGTTTIDALCYAYDATTQAAFDATFQCAGTPVSNLPHDNQSSTTSNVDVSIERKPGGAGGNCTDTGDNAADFATTTPATPMSSTSPPTP